MPNPYVNKVVQSNGTTLIDISDTTAVAADVASGKYFYLATGEKVAGSGSGGSSGYTRTVIAPQQTVTPDSSRQAVLSGVTVGFVDASHYIVTLDGVEWYGTCETLWGTNLTVGEVQWFWSTPGSYVYPFGAIYISGEGLTVAFADTNQHTVKIEKLELTGSGGGGGSATLITKNITANGTYSASDDDADGYSEVTVNVPSSAASSWTKVAETSYQVSTTSGTAANVAIWATGHSEIWTSNKIVYIRIRDTAGKRAGYFYGSDAFFINSIPINSASTSSTVTGLVKVCYAYKTDGTYYESNYNGNSGYGVYATDIYSDGAITIRRRYTANMQTINGTYKVEVYLLDPPTGAPIFE